MTRAESSPASTLAAAVFQRYDVELHRYLARHLRRPQDASDLAQEVYLRLLRLERGELVRQPNAYLFFVASQVVSQFKMRASTSPVIYDSDLVALRTENPAQPQADPVDANLQAQHQLEQLLRRLPPTHRDVLILRKRDGLSWREIASTLGLSVHTVKKYLHDARARISTMEWE